jgi:aryl-alcohol dehydrogenase-like predicted oxidoreductase
MTWSVDAGKAQTIGGSNFTMEQLRAALAASLARNLAPLRVLQPVYNLVAREAADGLFRLCAEHGIGITSYSPLGAGFLTGKYTGDRSAMPAGSRFAIKPAHADLYFHPANFEVLAQLRRLAEASGHSLATLAMAWVLRQPAIDSVLTGARDKSHLDNALHCMRHLTELAAVWEDAAHRFA